MYIRLRGWVILLLCLIITTLPAAAQSGLTARLSAPDASVFPTISAYLDVYDTGGRFVDGLQPVQVSVLEGEALLPVEKIETLRPGVQVVVAINPGPAFAIRNFQAVSRFDMIKQSLQGWARSRLGTSTDDWSLLITDGASISHTADPAKFLETLEADQVDDRTARPSLDTLARAASLAADPTPRPGMGRVILLITSSVEGEIDQALKDVLDQARQQGIIIHLWMVASSGALTTQSAQKLIALAGSTGGRVFTFSGEQTLPDPEEYLEAVRKIYRIEYQSKVGLSGEHQFAAQVQMNEETVLSNSQTFRVDLLPPEPAFISPPIVIERQMPEAMKNADSLALPPGDDPADFLFPKEVTLQVVFDFPDGRKRGLAHSALLIDGVVVAENSAAPFDQFTWKLDDYTSDASHQIQVEVRDELGLTGDSISVPVQITVERLQADPWFVLRQNLLLITVILLILAGGFLFLILVLGGRLRPVAQRAAHRWRKLDPVTHSVFETSEGHGRSLPGWAARRRHPEPPTIPNAPAFLHRVTEGDQAAEGPPIPIHSDETLLGSDSKQAALVLTGDCIEGVHARLTHKSDGSFWLADMGSISGTWINFNPISNEEVCLQNGDLVHFGRVGFRFTIRQPVQALKPAIALETNPESAEPDQQPKETA
ncbi:MAG: hypothetical protein B6D39_11460 [Anaerolineae bacterium UTCFX2]|jgi:hypothetical protein|nr:MAG: hypothetical protein B6D39_11460 [Anaerolineae bacterium UTCFX2]